MACTVFILMECKLKKISTFTLVLIGAWKFLNGNKPDVHDSPDLLSLRVHRRGWVWDYNDTIIRSEVIFSPEETYQILNWRRKDPKLERNCSLRILGPDIHKDQSTMLASQNHWTDHQGHLHHQSKRRCLLSHQEIVFHALQKLVLQELVNAPWNRPVAITS